MQDSGTDGRIAVVDNKRTADVRQGDIWSIALYSVIAMSLVDHAVSQCYGGNRMI